MDDPADTAPLAKTLRAIADCLDVPVESFFENAEAMGDLEAASECLRLWQRIKTADGRRRALEYLREVADEPQP